MDMRVSSDEIRSYVSAQTRIAKQALPEESRRVVLRLPTDSVNISPAARALQKGSLRVAMDDDGRFTKVTDDNSNPMMQLFDDGMSDIKEHLDKMKELTELMEDPTLSIEDRYATQMKLVEQEGELEKDTHDVYEKYMKMIHDFTRGKVADLWGAPKGATPSMDLVRAMESATMLVC